MGGMGFFWIVVAIVLVLVALWFVLTYNRMVSARNRTQEAWSQIDVELK
jgi:LemA protein